MVCKLDRPAPQALFDRTLKLFEANVLGGNPVIPESMEWYVVANDYAIQEEFYSIAEAQWKAQDPRYMCCADLYDYAAVRGFAPRNATASQGYVRVTGTPNSAVPAPLEFSIEGQPFRSIGTVPAFVPVSGFFPVRVKAITPGLVGNIAVKAGVGTLTSEAGSLNNIVEVYGTSFCGGSETEECEAFRTRFMRAHGYHPRANVEWIIDKLKEWPCVTRVCERGGSCCESGDEGQCQGCNRCSPNLGFYVMFDGTFDCGIPPSCVVTDLNTWMWGDPPGKGLGQADFGMCGDIKAPVASVIDVRVTGMNCASAAQQQQVMRRITDLFLTACPSTFFSKRHVELAIAQIVGISEAFEVTFLDRTGNMTFSPCGDLDPNCDILPCLGEIVFVDVQPQAGAC